MPAGIDAMNAPTKRFADNWVRYCADLFKPPRAPITVLEIGVWRGKTADWILRNICTEPDDRYVGIDPYEHGEQNTGRTLGAYRDARVVVGRKKDRAKLLAEKSEVVLRSAMQRQDAGLWDDSVDVAYIDGLHLPVSVMTDAVLCWPLLKIGGVMIFDDYDMPDLKAVGQYEGMQRGITSFVTTYRDCCAPLFVNEQLGIRKTASGFSLPPYQAEKLGVIRRETAAP